MVVGIDVAADRLNWVGLDETGAVTGGGVYSAGEIPALASFVADAVVIGIDAPAQVSTARHSDDDLPAKFRDARCAEIALGRVHKLWVPWPTPTARPTEGWMATGLQLYEELGRSPATLIEVYPYAAFRVLRSPLRLAKKTTVTGIRQRVEALRGVRVTNGDLELWSHDSLDACVAALIALHRSRGIARPVSCGHDDSVIWLPGYVRPDWPAEPFFLEAIPQGWTHGPFTSEDWGVNDDGSLVYALAVVERLDVLEHG